MRLYRALCAALEAYAALSRDDGPHPEGDAFSTSDLGRVYSGDPELHRAHRGQSIDDDDGGAYRSRPISLRWTPNP